MVIILYPPTRESWHQIPGNLGLKIFQIASFESAVMTGDGRPAAGVAESRSLQHPDWTRIDDTDACRHPNGVGLPGEVDPIDWSGAVAPFSRSSGLTRSQVDRDALPH